MQAIKTILVSRLFLPLWLVCLAIQTVFSPKYALEIMDNHYKQKQQAIKEKLDQLAK